MPASALAIQPEMFNKNTPRLSVLVLSPRSSFYSLKQQIETERKKNRANRTRKILSEFSTISLSTFLFMYVKCFQCEHLLNKLLISGPWNTLLYLQLALQPLKVKIVPAPEPPG